MLAKVFLQTIVPVFFGKFLAADPAAAGTFYDGDVFYMRDLDLSSNLAFGLNVSSCCNATSGGAGSYYGLAERTTK
jgi:hypothetical protein